jgi:antitoxin (DNA-binding transcriptional repressor) of toxin-antitoxin stability system
VTELGSTFSYRATAGGEVHIAWRGRTVTTLRAAAAKRFLTRAAATDDEGAQQLMARATGNFKHGNERRG